LLKKLRQQTTPFHGAASIKVALSRCSRSQDGSLVSSLTGKQIVSTLTFERVE
jgi:hypothetical protein